MIRVTLKNDTFPLHRDCICVNEAYECISYLAKGHLNRLRFNLEHYRLNLIDMGLGKLLTADDSIFKIEVIKENADEK